MTDPITNIEDNILWQDTGRQALMIFRGARSDGASMIEAAAIVAAFYEGMFRSFKQDEPTEQEQEDDDDDDV